MMASSMNSAPTLRTLLGEVYRELIHLDSRLWRTMTALVRPGEAAVLWTRGRSEGVLLPPFRLYLIASGLFFVTGGGLHMSELVAADIAEMVPDSAGLGLDLEFLRATVASRTLGWIALIRMASLVPFALVLALFIRRGQPRIAPAFVFAMNYFTVAFALAVFCSLVGWSVLAWPGSAGWEVWLNESSMMLERSLLLVWLVLGMRRFLDRGWLISILGAVLLALFDLMMLFAAFGIGVGTMGQLLHH
jgi:hypothetical protein